MGITQIISLAGGLALFLYGMQMMSFGMEAAVGFPKWKKRKIIYYLYAKCVR